jgi:hypothetical protein
MQHKRKTEERENRFEDKKNLTCHIIFKPVNTWPLETENNPYPIAVK